MNIKKFDEGNEFYVQKIWFRFETKSTRRCVGKSVFLVRVVRLVDEAPIIR